MNNLNSIDVGFPLNNSSLEEVIVEVRQLKETLKSVLLVSHLANGGIRDTAVSKVPTNSVGAEELRNSAVESGKIKDLAVETEKLAALSVTTAKLADDSVTALKIADNALETRHFGENTIPPGALNAQLSGDLLQSHSSDNGLRAISTNHLQNNSVTNRAVADVSFDKLTGGDLNTILMKRATGWTAIPLAGGLTFDEATQKFVTGTGLRAALFGQAVTLGTGGGAATTATWVNRLLSEIEDTSDFMTFASGNFSLKKGFYFMHLSAAAFSVGRHQIRFNRAGVVPSVTYGSTEVALTNTQTNSTLTALINVTEEADVFSLQHWVQTAAGTNDFGRATTGVTAESGQVDRFVTGFLIKMS